MSRGWIIAAVIFFFASCCFGAVIFAGLYGPEGVNSQEWKDTFDRPDAGK
jgi:hypothetical protein